MVEDTVKINGACELGAEAGSFGAGVAANKIADSYMDEMVEFEDKLSTFLKLMFLFWQIELVDTFSLI